MRYLTGIYGKSYYIHFADDHPFGKGSILTTDNGIYVKVIKRCDPSRWTKILSFFGIREKPKGTIKVKHISNP